MKKIICLVPENVPVQQIASVCSILAEFGEVEMVGSAQEPQEALAAVQSADLIYLFNPEGTVDDTLAYLIGFWAKSGRPMYALREPVGFNIHQPPIRAILEPARLIEVII